MLLKLKLALVDGIPRKQTLWLEFFWCMWLKWIGTTMGSGMLNLCTTYILTEICRNGSIFFQCTRDKFRTIKLEGRVSQTHQRSWRFSSEWMDSQLTRIRKQNYVEMRRYLFRSLWGLMQKYLLCLSLEYSLWTKIWPLTSTIDYTVIIYQCSNGLVLGQQRALSVLCLRYIVKLEPWWSACVISQGILCHFGIYTQSSNPWQERQYVYFTKCQAVPLISWLWCNVINIYCVI